ncbi:MAG: GH3 auxin-responsive promoter family protein [Saprospiraceae bacterium]|nr:GH3 auxin-responsive promoter family protein [Saprospiraceae bacterium]
MNIKNSLIHLVANNVCNSLNADYLAGVQIQKKIFKKLIQKASKTKFGKDHAFQEIRNYQDYKRNVRVREYEDFNPYIQEIQEGKKDILWPGLPKYFAKTSGTTSGPKYIPLTKDSIKNHINSARNALFQYLRKNPITKIFDGKMLFLSGTPALSYENGIAIGRLSGIVNNEIPNWFKKNKLPDNKINAIQPWEAKIDTMVRELSKSDIRVIGGIPPWIQMFCETLLNYTGKNTVLDVFPNLELYIHGGVNYAPYKQKINQLFGQEIALIETYPASEGFIAYQDNYQQDGMQLVLNDGIFYEFIPKDSILDPNAERIQLEDVSLNTDYAIILTTNAGLWSYLIGDLVRFVSLKPHKIKVSGRISQFISAFGEHVISSEIDQAISFAQKKHLFGVVEFTVAPQVSPLDNRHAYHEWFIEFSEIPKNLQEIANTINDHLCELNSYYKDLIEGKLLDTLKIRPIRKNGFLDYMRKVGKLGEQFKVHRLSNDRKMADILSKDIVKMNA